MSSGHGGKKAKKHEEEEHENHERWLVSYADMVTLLMCLFIVLFAISQVDTKKFAALSAGLSESFGAPIAALPGAGTAQEASVLDDLDAAVDVQIPPAPEADDSTSTAEEAVAAQKTQQEAQQEYATLSTARDQLQQSANAAGYGGAVTFEITDDGLVMHVVSDPVLFDAESAVLIRDGRRVLDAVAPALAALANPIEVQGHANSIPVTPGGPWSSNWSLSSARAVTVVERLIADGVAQNRLESIGYSDQRPLVPDTDPGAVTLNRRVDIVLKSDASAEANALLPGLDGHGSTDPAAQPEEGH